MPSFNRTSNILLCTLALVALMAGAHAAQAAPLAEAEVPAPLRPWVGWALRGHESARCPFVYDAHDDKRCAWPGVLSISVDSNGLHFNQDWQLYVEGFIPLPGDESLWPQEVRLDEVAAVVSPANGAPGLHAPAGTHTVSGRIDFERMPEFVQLAPQTGLVKLEVAGRAVVDPELDESGRLWLSGDAGRRAGGAEVTNALELRVFRRIVDEVPLQIVTRVDLDVAGEHREVLLGPALPERAIPMSLETTLPARLEPNGRLRIQLRPGRYTLTLVSREPGPVTALARPGATAPWPDHEVWVLDARNALRLVQIEGVPSVDPRQTSLPPEWRNLPAFRVGPDDAFRIVEKRRGDPEPDADRLALTRSLWLDFDGGGYTVNDQIRGQLSASWRLDAEPVLDLGRVAVDGEPWFITRRAGARPKGVELRRGDLDLSADARVEPRSALPALGWDHDFQSVHVSLHLPPGWQLLSATGVDRADDTWISRWTLFDLFLLLIVAAIAGRLWGWPWGLVALVAIGLVFHESGAPRQVWLHIFAATALLRVLPTGSFSRWMTVYRYLALGALLILLLPFAVNQVRVALFPQLELPSLAQPVGVPVPARIARGALELKQSARVAAPAPDAPMEAQTLAETLPGAISSLSKSYDSQPLERIDPKANIQTGPGLPRWQWNRAELIWNGPVARGQPLELVLLSPGVNLVLRLVSVVLLAGLAVRAFGVGGKPRPRMGARSAGAAAAVVIGIGLIGVPDAARAAEFPDAPLLDELRARLLEAPECAPECASLPRMRMEVTSEALTARIEVHVREEVAVPLPGRQGAWLPDEIQVDGSAAPGVYRDPGGNLWVALTPGIHQLVVSGKLPSRDRVEIALPLTPRRVEATAAGWEVDGIHDNGIVGEQIQLRRVGAATTRPEALEPGALPPFVRIERTLSLGLEWRVLTRVLRVSPPGAAIVLEVPLIEGEAVTTEGLRVENNRVQVALAAQAMQAGWDSVLEHRSRVELVAPDDIAWTELWQLDASPIWHVETSGIPVIHQQQQGQRFPQWRPWPGERISLEVTRPEGVPGNTLTIDVSELSLRPGQRATDAALSFEVRTSQGVQHPVTLPAEAELQSVVIDGRSQPVREEDGIVTLPLAPGTHEVELTWRAASGVSSWFTTPPVDLGAPSVNASTEVAVPRSRWVLFTGGPALGPAVLFWGLLIVIVAVAVGLGATRRTPLKTRHWVLLGLGLSQIPVYLSLIVVGWLFALDARRRLDAELRKWQFNLMQLGLVLLTVVALSLLFYAVQQGLLGLPDMQVAGNGSSGYELRWFQDRAGPVPPPAWMLSVPLTVYRLLMLAWALWIAFALIAWLRWSWEAFSAGGYWRSIVLRRPKRVSAPSAKAPPGAPTPE